MTNPTNSVKLSKIIEELETLGFKKTDSENYLYRAEKIINDTCYRVVISDNKTIEGKPYIDLSVFIAMVPIFIFMDLDRIDSIKSLFIQSIHGVNLTSLLK